MDCTISRSAYAGRVGRQKGIDAKCETITLARSHDQPMLVGAKELVKNKMVNVVNFKQDETLAILL